MSVLRLLDKTVSLVVGDNKRVFTMHKALICSVSSYFTAALKGNFKEATEQRIAFPEDNVWIFERFQLWLYSERVLDKDETIASLTYDQLVNLYAFADCRCIPNFQNDLIDLIIKKIYMEKCLPLPCDGNMYAALDRSSPLRKLAVDIAAYEGSFDESWPLEEFPKEYLVDLIRGLGVVRNEKKTKHFWKQRCDYHIHANCEPRCSGGSWKD